MKYRSHEQFTVCQYPNVLIFYRVVVVNIVAVGWNTYLAWVSSKVTEPQTPPHHSELDHLPPS